MRRSRQEKRAWPMAALLLLSFPASLTAQSASSSQPPVARGERLTFTLLWPSGISLGEATLEASPMDGQIQLKAVVAAGLPQYRISYTFTSITDQDFCSIRFSQTLREGARTRETLFDFDQENHIVRRTRDGATSESLIPACARDPLALLYHFRQQLASGQATVGASGAAGDFHLGSDYSVRYEPIPAGTEMPGSTQGEGNGFLITARGSNVHSFEMWIRPDDARTPVAVRVPFSLATFSAVLE